MKKLLLSFNFILALSFIAFSVDHHRWPIKTTPAHRTNARIVPLFDIISMPDPPGVTMNDARYEDSLIPLFSNPINLKEGDLVKTEGYLWLVAYEDNDGEYHIQVSGNDSTGNNCLIVEVPDPVNTNDAALKTKYEKVRTFIKDKVLHGIVPGKSGNLIGGRAYVYVKGQLFFDASHTHNQMRGKKGMRSNSLWEIHPIVEMDFTAKH
jgi:hypothetical protein